MKKIFLCLFAWFIFAGIHAQVAIRPLPGQDYEFRLRKFIDGLIVVDTHEHLLVPEKMTDRVTHDFIMLLSHYSNQDIISSGLKSSAFNLLMKDSLTVPEKWEILKPWWENSFNTAYCRNALLAAENLYGISDFNDSTVVLLSERIKNAYEKKDWFYDVLEKGRIEFVIQDGNDRSFKGNKFRYVERFDAFINIRGKNSVESLSKSAGVATIQTFDDVLAALEKSFEAALERGFVGVKSGLAYNRILHYEKVSREKAEDVFMSVMAGKTLSFGEIKPLQDYMMHQVIRLAEENHLPMIIHTGLQAGNGNIIENSKPTHLVNLFQEYPGVRFVLYHGSFPYGGELSTLAKNFSNVYIDLCWLYIISPSYAERYLHEWLETIPVNKIMGFGGDFWIADNSFAHLHFARKIISNVLVEKVKTGYFSEEEAKKIASMILYENAKTFYKL